MHYETPLVKEVLESLNGCSVFSETDMASGYFSIPLEEESRRLTTFITPFGMHRFKGMAMGLMNAGRYFQYITDITLVPRKMRSFQDDVAIGVAIGRRNRCAAAWTGALPAFAKICSGPWCGPRWSTAASP